MPSPLVHLAAGSLIAHETVRRTRAPFPRAWKIWGVCLFFSMAPDLDSVAGFLANDMGKYHNQFTHSLFFAVLFCLALAWPVRKLIPAWSWKTAFLVPLLCYALHSLLDWATRGRGVLLFWPFFRERLLSPVILFYGVRWSDGLLSWRHGITLGSEILTLAVGFGLYRLWRRRRANGAANGIDSEKE